MKLLSVIVAENERFETNPHNVRVSDITRLYTQDKRNADLVRRAIEVEALPESWRGYFRDRLEKLVS
jgi:MOSC domain-containing protein YiiM